MQHNRTTLRHAHVAAGLAVIAAIALTGCGRADVPTEGPSAGIGLDPATGSLALWAPEGDATALSTTLAPFLEENPDLDLEITLIPSDEYTTKLQAALAAGSGPDVAQLYTEGQSPFTAGGSFAAVPDGLVDPSDFFQGAWEAGVVDGTAYSVPWYAYAYAFVYRADLAAAAGVDAPETWDETVPFLTALQSAGAVRGLGAEIGWGQYTGAQLSIANWQAGGELISPDGSEWTLDTPEMIAAFEYYASFFLEGTADTDTPTFLDAQPYFVEGKTAAIVTGPWVIGQFDGVAGEVGWTAEHVGTVPLPAGSAGGFGAVQGGSWGVPVDAKNPDAAWKLIRALSDPAIQVAQYQSQASMPAVLSAWDDQSIASQPLLDAFFTQLLEARAFPSSPNFPQVSTQMGVELERIVKGGVSPADAAASLQQFAASLGTGQE